MPAVAFLALFHPFGTLASAWSIHPSTVIGIAALAALYVWRTRVARATPDAPSPTTGQRAAFTAGLALMFLSLNGPLHDLSDGYLFSAHMVQHLLLTMVVTPLLILGTPGWMLRPALRAPRVASLARWVTQAPVAFTLFNATMLVWHLPPAYNYALAHHPVHIVQHLCFLVTSTLMWWPLMSTMPELPRASFPAQMLYSFLMTIPMTAISVCITYADGLLYPAYAAAPRIFAISPLEDQRLGGLIMWIPGGFVFVLVLSIVFFKWASRDVDHTPDWHPPRIAPRR